MGGVGWGRFVAISPLQKMRGGHALKAAFVTEGNSSSIAARTWAVGIFKLRAKNNVHHQKESELAKKTYFTSSFLSMHAHCSRRTRKVVLTNSVANVCYR